MAFFEKLGKYQNTALFLMRVGLSAMMIVHGFPKLTGGPDAWGKLGQAMGVWGIHVVPVFWGFMCAATEAIGGLLLILGLWFRPVCLLMMINLAVAASHHFAAHDGINGAAHAIEDGIAFLGLFILGPGKYSVDGA
jgi:putative oxidoreductase